MTELDQQVLFLKLWVRTIWEKKYSFCGIGSRKGEVSGTISHRGETENEIKKDVSDNKKDR